MSLPLLTLIATVVLIVVAQFARRNPDPASNIHLLRKVLTVIVLMLAAVYFYMRFSGS